MPFSAALIWSAFFVVSAAARTLNGSPMIMSSKLLALASTVLFAVASSQAAAPHRAEGADAEGALKKLQAGNARYLSKSGSSGRSSSEARKASAKHQRPFAVIVSCSDSRVAPEIVFDQHVGDLFTIRTPANLVDAHVLGGIEYAVERLGAKLIVVLGVKRCCFMESAVADSTAPERLGGILRELRPSILAVKKDQGDVLVNAIHENIYRTADKIARGLKVGEVSSSVRIVRALYDVDTGKVEILK
jgi:carbonic anhydrase